MYSVKYFIDYGESMMIENPRIKCKKCGTELKFEDARHKSRYDLIYAYCPKCTDQIIEIKPCEQIGI